MKSLQPRILEVFGMYNDGLVTQSEALYLILEATTRAIGEHSQNVESVLFEQTGKRPYSLGL